VLAETDRLGLDLNAVTDRLVEDGVKLFAKAFDGLLAAIARKRDRFRRGAAEVRAS
jgi:transaldolase/glucose-6-phosphate isomerase